MVKIIMELVSNNDVHNYLTRNRQKFRLFECRTSGMLNGVLNSSISAFNNLPQEIRNSTTRKKVLA